MPLVWQDNCHYSNHLSSYISGSS